MLLCALQAGAQLFVDGAECSSYSSNIRRVALNPTHTCKVRCGTAGAMQRRWLLLAIWCAASERTCALCHCKTGLCVCVCVCALFRIRLLDTYFVSVAAAARLLCNSIEMVRMCTLWHCDDACRSQQRVAANAVSVALV